jgi:hypothetical protein
LHERCASPAIESTYARENTPSAIFRPQTPPQTPDAVHHRIEGSESSPNLEGTPTTTGRTLRKHAASIVPTVKETFESSFGEHKCISEYQKYDVNVTHSNAKDHFHRFSRVAALFLVTPPSDPEVYAKEHQSMINMLFATEDRYQFFMDGL